MSDDKTYQGTPNFRVKVKIFGPKIENWPLVFSYIYEEQRGDMKIS
jgi:hypothetical protein